MSDLPSGAVTFVFTDIEGSTRLVRQLRDGYREVLDVHQRLLRDAFAKHGGHEIDTQGDAFFYAFGSAAEAVHAAIEGQHALSEHLWPEDAAVRVRIGIHSARASPAEGRYTGLAVHRASRICSAGHGGQILVSQATQSLLEDEEEELAAALVDLDVHELKDAGGPPPRERRDRPQRAGARTSRRQVPALRIACNGRHCRRGGDGRTH